MQNSLQIFQHHFARVWAARHDSASARRSLRQNIKGQRDIRRWNAQTARA